VNRLESEGLPRTELHGEEKDKGRHLRPRRRDCRQRTPFREVYAWSSEACVRLTDEERRLAFGRSPGTYSLTRCARGNCVAKGHRNDGRREEYDKLGLMKEPEGDSPFHRAREASFRKRLKLALATSSHAEKMEMEMENSA